MLNSEENSFEDVYAGHYQNVFRTAYHLIRNRDDAKDITQEVFIRFIQSRKSIKNHNGIKSWLHRVTVNCAIDLIKKRKRKSPNTVESESLSYASPEKDYLEKERHYFLLVELDALPDKQKRALILRFFEGLPISEIAQFVGLTNASTRVTITRALLKLRKKLFKKRGLFHV